MNTTVMGIVFAVLGVSAVVRLIIDLIELKERLDKKAGKTGT